MSGEPIGSLYCADETAENTWDILIFKTDIKCKCKLVITSIDEEEYVFHGYKNDHHIVFKDLSGTTIVLYKIDDDLYFGEWHYNDTAGSGPLKKTVKCVDFVKVVIDEDTE